MLPVACGGATAPINGADAGGADAPSQTDVGPPLEAATPTPVPTDAGLPIPFDAGPPPTHLPAPAMCNTPLPPGVPADAGFDQCVDDGDCPANEDCLCGYATSGGRTRNVCVPANCHQDSDCGPGYLCTPEAGVCYGIAGFYCRTADDTCQSDADCHDGGQNGLCVFDPTVSHWACLPWTCDG